MGMSSRSRAHQLQLERTPSVGKPHLPTVAAALGQGARQIHSRQTRHRRRSLAALGLVHLAARRVGSSSCLLWLWKRTRKIGHRRRSHRLLLPTSRSICLQRLHLHLDIILHLHLDIIILLKLLGWACHHQLLCIRSPLTCLLQGLSCRCPGCHGRMWLTRALSSPTMATPPWISRCCLRRIRTTGCHPRSRRGKACLRLRAGRRAQAAIQ